MFCKHCCSNTACLGTAEDADADITYSCFDNTQNGDEVGIDCGGSCVTALAKDVVGGPGAIQQVLIHASMTIFWDADPGNIKKK